MPRTLCSHVGPHLLVPIVVSQEYRPHLFRLDQGQGAAQSIEDGAAIGILFSKIPQTSKDSEANLDAEISTRLSAFEDVRKVRASVMQIFSSAGQDEAEKMRDEAIRFLGPGIKVPSEYPQCCD